MAHSSVPHAAQASRSYYLTEQNQLLANSHFANLKWPSQPFLQGCFVVQSSGGVSSHEDVRTFTESPDDSALRGEGEPPAPLAQAGTQGGGLGHVRELLSFPLLLP